MYNNTLIDKDYSFRPRHKKKIQISRLSQLSLIAAGLGVTLLLFGGASEDAQANKSETLVNDQTSIVLPLPDKANTQPDAIEFPKVAKKDISPVKKASASSESKEPLDKLVEEVIAKEAKQPIVEKASAEASPTKAEAQTNQLDAVDTTEIASLHEAAENNNKTAFNRTVDDFAGSNWQSSTVRKGDTLGAIFQRLGLTQKTLHQIITSSKKAKILERIHPGDEILFMVNNGELKSISYEIDSTRTLNIQRTELGWATDISEAEQEIRMAYGNATIESSLFHASNAAGIPDKVTMQLADIFGWDIDFALDIREGDQFFVLYEEIYKDEEKIAIGDIVAVEFHNRDSVFQAVRYKFDDGTTDYFTPDGHSMRKAFMRSPVEFARISSKFNLKRKHPVLNKIRAHKGVDYAAQTGTPIRATGDGKYIHVGKKGGYGKTVIIQHGQRYSTLYAHLSKYSKKVRTGGRVKQGDIIGYVGKTGLATGPHLHYEFRVDGVHRDPLKVKFPDAAPISKNLRGDFHQQTSVLMAQLDIVKNIAVAMHQE